MAQNGGRRNGTNGNVLGLKVAIMLFTVLTGIASGLGAWNLARTNENSLDIRELKTLIRLYHERGGQGENGGD